MRPLLDSALVAWPSWPRYFIAWLIVAQALVHLTRRQRAVDALLIVVAAVLVGRALVAGSHLDFSEIVAIALVVPALVPLSRLERPHALPAGSRSCSSRGSPGSRLRRS